MTEPGTFAIDSEIGDVMFATYELPITITVSTTDLTTEDAYIETQLSSIHCYRRIIVIDNDC